MNTSQKQIDKINECIQDLVYEKIQLKKAYNYYHCLRDAEQFRHIEDNYGIGVPTGIGFTPLIKKHIDVLVGEYLELEPELSISCKDSKTLSNILRDKKLKIDKELYTYLKRQLQNLIIDVIFNGQQVVNDPFIEKELIKIQQDVDKSFTSEYEIAAQNILTYFRQSRDIDLKNKMRELFTDLLITGCCYYRVVPSSNGKGIELIILNPIDTFIERNRQKFYLNKSPRAVARFWYTREQVLHKYRKELTTTQVSQLDDQIRKGDRNYNTVYVRVPRTLEADPNGNILTRQVPSPGILGGLEVTPVFPWNDTGMYNYLNKPVIAVMEIEWMEWNEKEKKLDLYQGVKIGSDIYITRGKVSDDEVQRTMINPDDCSLTINGMFFLDKNGSPFSLMLATADLQDKYDLLLFYRDNLIATSGTVGDWIDLAHIPSALGVTMPERLEKWLSYKKNGLALFDSSQEGGQLINTTFQGYDDTIKAQSIQAIQIAIDSIELQAAAITGVFPEKLGQIQERDAVSNVKVGIKYSTLLTKQYFNGMDLMMKEVNYDMLNLAKSVYPKGLTGTIVLGTKLNKIFEALPKHYTVTDFDIHIQDSTETLHDRETIKSMTVEMIKANFADPEFIVNILTTKSMTELKQYVEQSMAQKREENNQVQQLSQQVEQYENNLKQMEDQIKQLMQENNQLEQRIEQNSEEKIAIEKKKLDIAERELRDKKDYNDKVIETKEKQIQAEIAQFYDSSPYNDKVKQVI